MLNSRLPCLCFVLMFGLCSAAYASAQELKEMAVAGLVTILDEHRTHAGIGGLIDRLTFLRKR